MGLGMLTMLLIGANAFDDAFAKANKAYENGRYLEAIVDYEQIIAGDVTDPVVFYNLGNAYYRNGQLGEAIANYERALHLRPGFTAAQDNLDQALQSSRRALPRPLPPAWERSLLAWHYGLSYRLTWTVAALAWVLVWCVLAVRLFRPVRYLRRGAAVLAVLAVAFSASAWIKAHPPTLAVVVEETVPVRFGKSDQEKVRFELYAGDRVSVDQRGREWSRVSTVSGERGWARNDQLILVGPPYELPTLTGKEPSGGASV